MSRSPQELSEKVFSDFWYFLAFGFGSGLSKKAPGTCGTMAAIPIYLILCYQPWYIYLGLVAIFFAAGVLICDKVSKDLGVHDHPGIVWDEIVGFLLAMWVFPVGLLWILIGFGLFRLFDIVKPPPIGYFDKKVQGGLGIMLDDVLAALYVLVAIQIFVWIMLLFLS